MRALETRAEQVRARDRGSGPASTSTRHAIAAIGEQPYSSGSGGPHGNTAQRVSGAHLGEVIIELSPAEERPVGGAELADRWRELIGVIPERRGAHGELHRSSVPARTSTSSSRDRTSTSCEPRPTALKRRLAEYTGVHEIADSFREGKREIKLDIKPAAELLGLTLADLARQVRQAFYGEEAQRIQRGRDDVRVMVRYPEDERRSLGDLENMRIRTPRRPARCRSQRWRWSSRGAATPRSSASIAAAPSTSRPTSTRSWRRRARSSRTSKHACCPSIRALHPGVLYSFEGQQASSGTPWAGCSGASSSR